MTLHLTIMACNKMMQKIYHVGEMCYLQRSPRKIQRISGIKGSIMDVLKAAKSKEANVSPNDYSSDDDDDRDSSDVSDSEGATGGGPPSVSTHQRFASIAIPRGLLDPSQQGASQPANQSGAPRKVTIRRTGSLREECLASTQRRVEDIGVYRLGAEGYSPKLEAGNKDDKSSRRIKLGSKAADLFAKLQMRLSSGKS